MRLLEQVAPDLANGKRVKPPSSAAKTGHIIPPSAWVPCCHRGDENVETDITCMEIVATHNISVGVPERDEVSDLVRHRADTERRKHQQERERN